VINLRYVLLLLLLSGTVIADSSSMSLSLPSSGLSYGTDSIKAGDLDCKNSIGGSTNFELGLTGVINNVTGIFSTEDINNPQSKDVGVYARLVIPLDAPTERINCNTLYQLELQHRRLEIEKLRQEIEMLKRMQFEND
tara:strand:- start:26 stop:439 length:414 start_codon:yes stop_codon:yes gene_type:complete